MHLSLITNQLDRGKKLEDPVEIVLPGTFTESPERLAAVDRAAADNSTPKAAVQSDLSAWRADDTEWIKSNFAAREQEALAKFLANEEIRKTSKTNFAKVEAVFLWGVVAHGDYRLALITYAQAEKREQGLVAAFIKEDGAWKRTNALSADETMDLVWTAFRGAGEITVQP